MFASTKRFKSFGNLAYMFAVALVIASLLVNAVPSGNVMAAGQNYTPPEPDEVQLNLSHIYCYDGDDPDLIGLVEIHFVLLNVPDGITPGTLTYTYGSIAPTSHTGNVWHYFDYKPDGYYDIQSASVVVDGETINLHNPGVYADDYECGTPPTDVCPNIDGNQATIPDGFYMDENGDCVPIPPDLCPNIDGTQLTVPDGFQMDDSGNCVPVPPDLCPNIDGTQLTIPDGFQMDDSGNCVPIPPDLCPNIDGTQLTVPDGFYVDDEGDCVPLPPDVCPNIDGSQATVPEGMYVDQEGDCVPIPPPPSPFATIDCFTLEFSSLKVTIGNSGDTGDIGYSTDLDPTIVSLGEFANGDTMQILVLGNATALYLYPEDGLGGWGSPVEVTLDKAETRVCEQDPVGLTQFCSYVDFELPFGWTVTNLNPFSIEFTWVYGPESSSGPIALAPGADISFTTGDHPGESMQIFVDGFLLASAEHEICPEFISLDLTGICSNDPASTHGWTVTNSNAFDVTAEWRVNGSLLTGLLDISANSSAQFTTPVSEGNIVQIYYGGVEQDNAGAAQGCLPPDNPPENPPDNPPQIFIPVTGGETPVLIPVTGVSNSLSGLAANGMLNLGLGFFGLGVILHGVARRRIQ
ncbi:MAG: hypothetical protein HY781_13060 [Chloroflexi bacterium]|nr:hypothetical protein [Chloroflexota bacterium]